MIRAIFQKLACRHKWVTRSSFVHKDDDGKIHMVTELWVCSECGKIERVIV